MKKIFSLLTVIYCFSASSQAQYSEPNGSAASNKVYHTSWLDGGIFAAGLGLSAWGLVILNEKEPLSQSYLDYVAANPEEAKEDIPGFDRWVAGNYNDGVATATDYPFYGSFALPLLYLANERTRSDFGQIGLLYLETMSITGALFTQTAGRTHRNRPLVYNNDPENNDRGDSKAENSFFAGHTAATASAVFFTAKVFNDYFPDSRAKTWVWVGAGVVSTSVAAGRLIAGKHFLSDNLIGLAVGTSVGILVPHFHKLSNERLSLTPFGAGSMAGMNMRYTF